MSNLLNMIVLKRSLLCRYLFLRPITTNVTKESRVPNNIVKSYYEPANQAHRERINT